MTFGCWLQEAKKEGYLDRLTAADREIQGFIQQQEIGRELDAGFDGGEFSGPGHDRILVDGINKILDRHGIQDDEWKWYIVGFETVRSHYK